MSSSERGQMRKSHRGVDAFRPPSLQSLVTASPRWTAVGRAGKALAGLDFPYGTSFPWLDSVSTTDGIKAELESPNG